jgi:hypothetical protein
MNAWPVLAMSCDREARRPSVRMLGVNTTAYLATIHRLRKKIDNNINKLFWENIHGYEIVDLASYSGSRLRSAIQSTLNYGGIENV